VAAGRFREDLYFRLAVVPLKAPPLRERSEDIPLLCQAFVQQCARENGLKEKPITPEALAVLSGFEWPGNVRELRNVIERLVILSEDSIGVGDLPEEIVTEVARKNRPERTMAALDLPPETRTLPLRELRDLIERSTSCPSWMRTAGTFRAPPRSSTSSAPTCTRRCARSASRATTGASQDRAERPRARGGFATGGLRATDHICPSERRVPKRPCRRPARRFEKMLGDNPAYRKVEEGFFVIKQGSSRVMIRVHPWKDHAVIRLAAQLVKGVRMEAPLALELLELKRGSALRIVCLRAGRRGRDPLLHPGRPRAGSREEFLETIRDFAFVADEYDDRIAARYGGRPWKICWKKACSSTCANTGGPEPR